MSKCHISHIIIAYHISDEIIYTKNPKLKFFLLSDASGLTLKTIDLIVAIFTLRREDSYSALLSKS